VAAGDALEGVMLSQHRLLQQNGNVMKHAMAPPAPRARAPAAGRRCGVGGQLPATPWARIPVPDGAARRSVGGQNALGIKTSIGYGCAHQRRESLGDDGARRGPRLGWFHRPSRGGRLNVRHIFAAANPLRLSQPGLEGKQRTPCAPAAAALLQQSLPALILQG
jgi:hypothetical protein